MVTSPLAMLSTSRLPVLFAEFGEHGGADGACDVAAHGGLQLVDADLLAGDGRDQVQSLVGVLAGERIARAHSRPESARAAHLHRTALEARGLDPGVLAFGLPIGEVGIGLALPRMQGILTLVIGVLGLFRDAVDEDLVAEAVEAVHGRRCCHP